MQRTQISQSYFEKEEKAVGLMYAACSHQAFQQLVLGIYM